MKGRCLKVTVLCGAMAALALGTAAAQEAKDATLKIERVALFKNGLGYFVSSGALPAGAKTVRIGQLPVPSLGTFWVATPKALPVRSLVTGMEEVGSSVPITGFPDLLAANVGKRVTLEAGGKETPIQGTIVRVVSAGVPVEPPNPYIMDRRRQPNERYPYGGGSPLVMIRTEKGLVALNAATVSRVDFGDADAVMTSSVTSKCPRIRMEFDKPASGEKVEVTYLARGITWTPGYLIDLSDPKSARFSANAFVINEVADLDGVQVDLVTGFPNIQFADVNSPVAMSQSLADFLQAFGSGRSEERGRRSNMMQQQALFSNATADYDQGSGAAIAAYSTAREGATAEDLFLYPVDRLTLKRGETAHLPLFTVEVPYEHIYTWKVDDYLDESGNYRQAQNRDNGQPKTEEVWHCCRLTNTMKMPWTTATAEFVKNGQFTGQDTCFYTGPGARTTVRINRAMSVGAEQAEFEVERKRNAANFHGYSYDLVKVEGKLRVFSRLPEAIKMEVTKELSGDLLSTDPTVKDTVTAKGLKQVNPRHVLTWEVNAEPGKELILTYAYTVYVRG